MNAEQILIRLRRELEEAADKVADIRCFLFGSFLVDPNLANDIDLLVVYPEAGQAAEIRRMLKLLCIQFPVHLLLASKEEERELDFIHKQRCEPIYPIEGE